MIEFKINYQDGTGQTLTSKSPMIEGDWMVFRDGTGEILRLRTAEIDGVERVNGGQGERK